MRRRAGAAGFCSPYRTRARAHIPILCFRLESSTQYMAPPAGRRSCCLLASQCATVWRSRTHGSLAHWRRRTLHGCWRSVGAAGVIPVPCGGVLRTPGAGVLMPAPAGQGDNDGLALRKKKKNQDSAHRHVGPLLVPCAPTRRQACRRPAAVRRCACGLPMASALRRFTATQPRHAGRQQGNRQNEANRKS